MGQRRESGVVRHRPRAPKPEGGGGTHRVQRTLLALLFFGRRAVRSFISEVVRESGGEREADDMHTRNSRPFGADRASRPSDYVTVRPIEPGTATQGPIALAPSGRSSSAMASPTVLGPCRRPVTSVRDVTDVTSS